MTLKSAWYPHLSMSSTDSPCSFRQYLDEIVLSLENSEPGQRTVIESQFNAYISHARKQHVVHVNYFPCTTLHIASVHMRSPTAIAVGGGKIVISEGAGHILELLVVSESGLSKSLPGRHCALQSFDVPPYKAISYWVNNRA